MRRPHLNRQVQHSFNTPIEENSACSPKSRLFFYRQGTQRRMSVYTNMQLSGEEKEKRDQTDYKTPKHGYSCKKSRFKL